MMIMKKMGKGLIIAVVFACIIGGTMLLRNNVGGDVESRREASIRDAVLSAARECYVVEGVYPPTLEYLEEHYGLLVNHKRYIITYDCFAPNQAPEVMVLKRR